MLSRVAYNLYWAARYLERAENVARFLGVNQELSLEAHLGEEEMWAPLIKTTGDEDEFLQRHDTYTRANVVHFLAYDREYGNSIISSLSMARENARAVRNVISLEMWLRINELYLQTMADADRADIEEQAVTDFFEAVKLGCITVHGVVSATMSRNDAWHWWRVGTMLERADKTSRILDVKYFMLLPSLQDIGSNIDHVQWIALLDSASASQVFRQYQRQLTPREVANFLILDQYFPRAISYAIAEAHTSLHGITGTRDWHYADEAERELGRLRAELLYADIDDIIAGGLHEYLDRRQKAINHIHERFCELYFGC